MRALVADDEPERPSNNATYPLSISPSTFNTTSTNTGMSMNVIVTTGGYVTGDPPPPEPYRTKAWVEKPKEIEANGEATGQQ